MYTHKFMEILLDNLDVIPIVIDIMDVLNHSLRFCLIWSVFSD